MLLIVPYSFVSGHCECMLHTCMSYWKKKRGHGNKRSETFSDFAVHGLHCFSAGLVITEADYAASNQVLIVTLLFEWEKGYGWFFPPTLDLQTTASQFQPYSLAILLHWGVPCIGYFKFYQSAV